MVIVGGSRGVEESSCRSTGSSSDTSEAIFTGWAVARLDARALGGLSERALAWLKVGENGGVAVKRLSKTPEVTSDLVDLSLKDADRECGALRRLAVDKEVRGAAAAKRFLNEGKRRLRREVKLSVVRASPDLRRFITGSSGSWKSL